MKSAEHILISRASKKSQLESLKMAIKTLGVCVCVCVCVCVYLSACSCVCVCVYTDADTRQ